MKGPLADLMKQAQKMQENMRKAQEEIGNLEIQGESGAGVVKVTMKCNYEVKGIAIDSSILDDKEMLEDLIAAAINDALRKVKSTTEEKMSGLMGGLALPPGMKLPF